MKVKGRNGEWGEGELMGKGGACSGESEEEEDIGVEECVSCLQTSLAISFSTTFLPSPHLPFFPFPCSVSFFSSFYFLPLFLLSCPSSLSFLLFLFLSRSLLFSLLFQKFIHYPMISMLPSHTRVLIVPPSTARGPLPRNRTSAK